MKNVGRKILDWVTSLLSIDKFHYTFNSFYISERFKYEWTITNKHVNSSTINDTKRRNKLIGMHSPEEIKNPTQTHGVIR
jgi:hypothetical protein